MPINLGNQKEAQMIYALNNRKVGELSNNLKHFITTLFCFVNDNDVIKAYKVDDANKTDFVIEINGQEENISLKTGGAEVVHNEILDNFVDYLRSEGISEETIETIKLFHYGDGSTDGTGTRRLGYLDVVSSLKERIKKANVELNKDVGFVVDTLDHCVLVGANSKNIPVTAIYFGELEYGVFATRRQIETHFARRTKAGAYNYMDHLHIGPLLLRPDARYVGKTISDERKRERIVVYWPRFSADLEFISKRYDY